MRARLSNCPWLPRSTRTRTMLTHSGTRSSTSVTLRSTDIGPFRAILPSTKRRGLHRSDSGHIANQIRTGPKQYSRRHPLCSALPARDSARPASADAVADRPWSHRHRHRCARPRRESLVSRRRDRAVGSTHVRIGLLPAVLGRRDPRPAPRHLARRHDRSGTRLNRGQSLHRGSSGEPAGARGRDHRVSWSWCSS